MEEAVGYSYKYQHCGDWISLGTWHSCGSSYWPYTVTVTNADDRIARALERIADALDKLIEFYPKG